LNQPAGVVDQHVDAAELGHGLLHEIPARGGSGYVTADDESLSARPLDLGGYFLRLALALVLVDRDPSPIGPKCLGRRRSDSSARAGDQHDFILQIFYHCLLPQLGLSTQRPQWYAKESKKKMCQETKSDLIFPPESFFLRAPLRPLRYTLLLLWQ